MDEKYIEKRKAVTGNHQLLRAGNIASTLVYIIKYTILEWDDPLVQHVIKGLCKSLPTVD